MRRLSFLAASLAGLTAPAVAADGAAAATALRVGGTPDPGAVAVIYAQKSGLFQKSGLTVEWQRLSSGSAISEAVVGGALDVGKSSIFALLAGHARGIPFVIESQSSLYSSRSPNVGLVVAADSPIASGRDFNGKTIASPALDDLFSTVAKAWIEQNGGDPKTVMFVELPVTATAGAIGARRIDGAVMTDPTLSDAVASGRARVIGRPFDTIAKRFGVTYYFSMRDASRKNADALARFRRCVAQSTDYAVAHWHEVAPLIADYTGMSLTLVQNNPSPLAAGVDLAMLQPTIDFAARYNIIPAGFPARDLVDPAALTNG